LKIRLYLMKNWMSLRNDPLWFLIGSAILILIVVLGSSTYLVNRIRVADTRRTKLFHNLEYTNKMASIGRLAASVAHEINNPLAIINEKAGLLKDMATFTDDFTKKDKVINLVASIMNSPRGWTFTVRSLIWVCLSGRCWAFWGRKLSTAIYPFTSISRTIFPPSKVIEGNFSRFS